jgi:RNA polymerase primary sigma factor
LKTSLHTLVAGLPERLRRVIEVRYELEGERWQTLAELGDEMGLSGERVRQLEVEALVWMRHPARSQELRELLGRHSLQEYEWAEEVAQAWLRRRGGQRG